MKKHLFVLIISCLIPLWGCSSSSNGVDPLGDFKTFASDLRQLAYDETLQAGKNFNALPDEDPKTGDYLIVTEDLYLQYGYCTFIFNKVLNFDIGSGVNNVYTNEDRDATIDISGGLYMLEAEYFMMIEDAWEKVSISFTWNPETNRWLIVGLRGGSTSADPFKPWIRQEGEWDSESTAYTATTFYIEEEGVRHVNNIMFTYATPSSGLRMACEREACTVDCLDTDPENADLYNLGILTGSLTLWDDFKIYAMSGAAPDYEVP